MKSILKVFNILEYVILQNGSKVTPSQVSEALKINIATCTRIMGALVSRGYLHQISRKEGYIPGPMVTALGTHRNAYERIANAAREPLTDLANKIGSQVNIAVMEGSQRIMLFYHMPDPEMRPFSKLVFGNHWGSTAVGRLLVAAEDDKTARSILKEDGVNSYPVAEIEQIRKNGFVRYYSDHVCLDIIGHWIKVPGYPTAAFGFGVEPEKADEAFQLSKEAAQKITVRLNKPVRVF